MSAVVQIETIGSERLIGALIEVERIVEHLEPIFERLGEEALTDTRRHVDNHPGPPLSASTIKRKGSARILRDKDDLYGSLQKGAPSNVFRVRPTEGEFGTVDFKAALHQTGTSRMPKRTIIEITGEQEARYGQIAVSMLGDKIKALGFEVT